MNRSSFGIYISGARSLLLGRTAADTVPMRQRLTAGLAGLLLCSTALAQDAATLKIGDPAPALSISKWVKGEAVDSFAKDSVYMIEFWATW